MFQTGLFNLLKNTAALTALLGTSRKDLSTGIFAMLATNEALLPYLVYSRLSGAPAMTFAGATKLNEAKFRFSCYGSSQQSAANIAEQIKLLFASYLGSTLSDGTVVICAENVMEADASESSAHGTIYSVHLDFKFVYYDNS